MWLHTILKSCIKLNDIVMNKPLFFMLLFCEIYILKLLTFMNAYNAWIQWKCFPLDVSIYYN